MRYIDADKLKEQLEDFSKWCRDGRKQGVDFVLDCPLPDIPTEDVVPRAEVDQAKQEVANLIIQEMQGRLNRLMYLEAPRHIQIECYMKVQIELDEVKKKYIGE